MRRAGTRAGDAATRREKTKTRSPGLAGPTGRASRAEAPKGRVGKGGGREGINQAGDRKQRPGDVASLARQANFPRFQRFV